MNFKHKFNRQIKRCILNRKWWSKQRNSFSLLHLIQNMELDSLKCHILIHTHSQPTILETTPTRESNRCRVKMISSNKCFTIRIKDRRQKCNITIWWCSKTVECFKVNPKGINMTWAMREGSRCTCINNWSIRQPMWRRAHITTRIKTSSSIQITPQDHKLYTNWLIRIQIIQITRLKHNSMPHSNRIPATA